jgi:hypothetical protein
MKHRFTIQDMNSESSSPWWDIMKEWQGLKDETEMVCVLYRGTNKSRTKIRDKRWWMDAIFSCRRRSFLEANQSLEY